MLISLLTLVSISKNYGIFAEKQNQELWIVSNLRNDKEAQTLYKKSLQVLEETEEATTEMKWCGVF